MEGLFFNVNNGYVESIPQRRACLRLKLTPSRSYVEGIVRGYRNGLLTGANYTNMTQCETIDGQPLFHLYLL